MSKDASSKPAPLPEPVVSSWWTPFGEHLERERRCSPYTARNYRTAFEDLYRFFVPKRMMLLHWESIHLVACLAVY